MEPGTISDIAASSIALIALGLTIWEARQTRKHDRLGLLPLLRFDIKIVPEQPRAEITLINKGTGFAAITSSEMKMDGKTSQELNINRVEDLTKYLGLAGDVVSYQFLDSTTILSAGETTTLVSVPIGEWSAARTKAIRDAFRKLTYKITYRSPYGKTQVEEFSGTKIYGERE